MGAKVTGFALAPDRDLNLFEGAVVATGMQSCIGDLRDRDQIRSVVRTVAPEIVLHMAAQAIVRRAHREPVETVATNVLGTMHLLDALRERGAARVILVVTSDKVYDNADRGLAFREGDPLGGREIYSASKAATEILTRAMALSHFAEGSAIVATARGGNVIGGGDYAEDRLVPDIVRAVARGEPVVLRNPDAIRPWQHVLDCVAAYLIYIQALAANAPIPHALNVGPEPTSVFTVRDVAEQILQGFGSNLGWQATTDSNPYEAKELLLDTALSRDRIGWRERLPGKLAFAATANWYRAVAQGASMRDECLMQINAYMGGSALPS